MAYIGNDVDAIFLPESVNTSTSLTITGGALTQTGGDVNFDNGTLFIDEDQNRVGIGTASPTEVLDIVGNVNISSGSNYLINGSQISTANVTENASYLYYTDTRSRNAISVTNNGGDGSLSYNSGTGVITYTGPSATDVRAHFSAGTGVSISNGQISIGQAVGTSDSVSFANVGIGTTSPTEVLEVIGNVKATSFLGNATTSGSLATPRTISITGDGSGSASFDGSADVSISLVVANDSHTHDSRYYTEAEADARYLGINAKAADSNLLDGINSSNFLRSDTADSWDIGRGDVYIENNSNDNADGAGITFRTSTNPSSTGGAIFAVRSSGQAARLWVGQDVTSTGYNPLYVGTSDSIDALSTPYILLPTSGNITRGGNVVWDAGNDGSGSGLDADTLDGAQPSVSASNSTIVQRHSSGYIYANYFNTTPDDVTSGVTKVCVETGNDGFIRHGTADAIRSFLNIESGATGDQSASEILTAIKTVDGSGSGLDADLLDGINSGSFLRSDANDSFSGNLTGSGTILTTGTYMGITGDGGGVVMTTNDGYGNANLCFNHRAGIPDANGSACRIETSVDNSTGFMLFEIGNNVTSGTAVTLTETLKLTTSDITYKSNAVWHAGNDGAGSGLDADTLDGINSTGFTDSYATSYTLKSASDVGYTATSSSGRFDHLRGGLGIASVTFAQALSDAASKGVRLPTVEELEDEIVKGTGGGYDSQICWTCTQVPGKPGYVYAKLGTGAGTRYEYQTNSTQTAYTRYVANVNVPPIWHSGNDGSGSGLDADLLDGQQGSYYLNTSATTQTKSGGLNVSGGRLLVGTSSPPSIGDTQDARLVVKGNTGSTSSAGHIAIAGSSNSNSYSFGHEVGVISFTDARGDIFAEIRALADTYTGSTNDSPGMLSFSTTRDGGYNVPTERLRMNDQGALLGFSDSTPINIGTSNGAGTSNLLVNLKYSSSSVTSGNTSFRIFTNGNTQNTNNSYGAISDIKLKENIVDASSQWDDIKALRVRNYNFIEGQTHTQIGVVAQEVELISPGLVYESPDRDENENDLGTVTKSVNYSVLYMKAVKALQEAMERIEILEAKVAALEAS